jgi:hypothetical protein
MNATDRRVQEFVSTVNRCCSLTNVRLVWGKGASLHMPGEMRGSLAGYFSQPEGRRPGILAVARGKPRAKWLSVLAHEFAHMSQWFYNDPTWLGTTLPDGRGAQEVMDDWVDHKIELDADEIADVFDRVRVCELDADAKALQYIKDYKLPVNLKEFKQEVADMDYSYRLMQRRRIWERTQVRRGRLPKLRLN